MPIYEFRCKQCGTISEFLTVLQEDKPIFCRNCESLEMERIISTPSFVGRSTAATPGHTCCGREERCETPPCSTGGACSRD